MQLARSLFLECLQLNISFKARYSSSILHHVWTMAGWKCQLSLGILEALSVAGNYGLLGTFNEYSLGKPCKEGIAQI